MFFWARFSSASQSRLLTPDTPETDEVDSQDGSDKLKEIQRNQSRRFLNVCKEHLVQEQEVNEKYHERIFTIVAKLMKSSQSNQLKTLKVLHDRETADVMRKLQTMRRNEVCKHCLCVYCYFLTYRYVRVVILRIFWNNRWNSYRKFIRIKLNLIEWKGKSENRSLKGGLMNVPSYRAYMKGRKRTWRSSTKMSNRN